MVHPVGRPSNTASTRNRNRTVPCAGTDRVGAVGMNVTVAPSCRYAAPDAPDTVAPEGRVITTVQPVTATRPVLLIVT